MEAKKNSLSKSKSPKRPMDSKQSKGKINTLSDNQ